MTPSAGTSQLASLCGYGTCVDTEATDAPDPVQHKVNFSQEQWGQRERVRGAARPLRRTRRIVRPLHPFNCGTPRITTSKVAPHRDEGGDCRAGANLLDCVQRPSPLQLPSVSEPCGECRPPGSCGAPADRVVADRRRNPQGRNGRARFSPAPTDPPMLATRPSLPARGQVVRVRNRQCLIEEVEPSTTPADSLWPGASSPAGTKSPPAHRARRPRAKEPAYHSEQDPLECMMDEITGHVGFWGHLQPGVRCGPRRQGDAHGRDGRGGAGEAETPRTEVAV